MNLQLSVGPQKRNALAVYRIEHDISPDFEPSARSSAILDKILPHAGTPEAIRAFAKVHKELTSYWYWFMLGTLWVNYTGWSDLNLWKELFSSPRKNRDTSLMKPSELRVFRAAPDPIIAYRAHRPNEADWIAYTVDYTKACFFAQKRGVDEIAEYELPKAHVLCLFTRRGESEVLMLDKSHARHLRTVKVVFQEGEAPDA